MLIFGIKILEFWSSVPERIVSRVRIAVRKQNGNNLITEINI